MLPDRVSNPRPLTSRVPYRLRYASRRYMENASGSQGLFCLILTNRSRGIKYQFLKKIYDLVNKKCAFKLKKSEYFYRNPIAVNGNGNQFPRFSLNELGYLSFLLHNSM